MGHPHRISKASTPRAADVEAVLADPTLEKKRALLGRAVFWKPDLALLLGRCGKTLDRWVDKGVFPKPDRYVNGDPVWFRGTLSDWAGGEAKLWGAPT